MSKIVLFWILLGGVGFAFALAVQMRMMTALVLRRALQAWRDEFHDREKANAAVVLAAASGDMTADPDPLLDPVTKDGASHLRSVYPNPLVHLRTARRYSVITPVLLLGLVIAGRTILGVI